MDCIFCKIVSGDIPAPRVFENDTCIAFNDIRPKAKTHVLIVPRRHIDSVMTLKDSDKELVGELVLAAKKIAEDLKLEGYQLKFHVGEKGGQEVFHIHLHLLAD